jgi:molybdopterin-guanine dinucleotide biosynthesis protein MobB
VSRPQWIALVGPHDAGKTGLAIYLVGALALDGVRVGVIKRAARPLQFDRSGKDSARYLDSGSLSVITQAPGLVYTQSVERRPASLQKLVRPHRSEVDFWLVESYQPERVPWVLVARRGQPTPALDRYCVATFGQRPRRSDRPHFRSDRPGQLYSFLRKSAAGWASA